jgi:hypothetical protein
MYPFVWRRSSGHTCVCGISERTSKGATSSGIEQRKQLQVKQAATAKQATNYNQLRNTDSEGKVSRCCRLLDVATIVGSRTSRCPCPQE